MPTSAATFRARFSSTWTRSRARDPGDTPGAVSAPWIDNLDADARFKTPDELRRRYEALGVDGTNGAFVYCGSGVNACHDLLALELAGFSDVRLYEGSWSDWSSRDAPVATGDKP